MQATFQDQSDRPIGQPRDEVEAQRKDQERLEQNQERAAKGEKTIGGSVAREGVKSTNPSDFDTSAADGGRGGQGDHLPVRDPVI